MKKRLHEMDAIRGIAMWLGVVLHSAIAYNIDKIGAWPHDHTYKSYFFDFLYHWIHVFRMPLFFLIAGFFARLLLLKIGKTEFIKHRIKRIVLPLLLGFVSFIPFTSLPFKYYVLDNANSLNHNIFSQMTSEVFTWNGLFHLWFLYYLVLYYLIIILLKSFFKTPSFIQVVYSRRYRFNFKNIAIFTFVLFIIISLIYDSSLHVYTGLRVNIGQFLYYALFFYVGYIIHKHINILDEVKRATWLLLIPGCLLSIIFSFNKIYGFWSSGIINDALVTLQIILLVFGFLGFFIRFFKKENKVIRLMSDSAYWMYLCHLFIVATLQLFFIDSTLFGPLKFILVLSLTIIVSLVTYFLFVRYTIIGTILNGKKSFRKNEVENSKWKLVS